MGGGDHINIFGCFAGSGSYGADTELEITNGQNYQMYKVYNLGQAGNEYRTGLEINLKESFKIFAQNSAEYLMLSLKIMFFLASGLWERVWFFAGPTPS